MDLELGFITSASVMTVFHDGANADKVARDYMKEEEDFPENGRVRIKMAPGGGWAAIIK
jgi:alpha-glucosidase